MKNNDATMRRYTIWIAAVMAAASCEPSHLNDNMYEPAVYFVNGGLTRETIYSVEGSHTVQVHAYCGGIESIDPEVVVEVDRSALDTYNINTGESLEFLPESCYTIESAPKKMSGNRVTFDIVFDCQKLEELSQQDDFSDLEGYAVPVMLRSLTEGVMVAGDADLCSAVIIPDMEMMGFTFEQAGVKSVDLTEFSDADGVLTYEYRLSTPVENHWDNPVRFIFPAESPDAEYGPLPEGSYTVTYYMAYTQGEDTIVIERCTDTVKTEFLKDSWYVTEVVQKKEPVYCDFDSFKKEYIALLKENNGSVVKTAEILRETYPWIPREEELILAEKKIQETFGLMRQ